jgi:hypothetical protein
MLTVMTWNLENLERPAASATAAARDAYTEKLDQIASVVVGAEPDLVGVQEVLAPAADLAPQVFEDLMSKLSQLTGTGWNGRLSQIPDGRGIRVGWLSPGQLTDPTDAAAYPTKVPPVVVDDTGQTITASKRGALAVTYTHSDGIPVHVLTAHLKSKLLTFPAATQTSRASTPATRANGPATASMPSPSAPRKQPPPEPGRPTSCTMAANTAASCSAVISTTHRRRPLPRSCSARPDHNWAPAASPNPTKVTRTGCGT